MDYFSIASILVVLSALFGYINVRFLKLPTTIGLMVITLVFTLVVVVIAQYDDTLYETEKALISSIILKVYYLILCLVFYYLQVLYTPILHN